MTVGNIMTPTVVTVLPDLPLCKLISLLMDLNIGGVPVVDEGGFPIGMVSKSDLVSDEFHWDELCDSARAPREGAAELECGGCGTVEDVMTHGSLSVLPTATVQEASALMVAHHVHRLTIVDRTGRLIGILTTFDIARWAAAAVELHPA